MIKWKKPSGVGIQTNDTEEAINAAKRLGWELIEDKPKRGRKPKKKEE